MISVAEARAHLIGAVCSLETEIVDLCDASGRVLAKPLIARRDQPPCASSAMDGYAFRAAPVAKTYFLVGESAAGRAFTGLVANDEAVRISTGAAMPEGADTVLAQEDATLNGDMLEVAGAAPGRHIRPRAGDYAAGEILLHQGRRLDPISLALAASGGFTNIEVARRPKVAVIANGDELVSQGETLRNDQVYESASYAVGGLVDAWGGQARRHTSISDQRCAIADAVASALAQSDILVLIGGASVGPHDQSRSAIKSLGFQLEFEKVSVRPGKPTWFARRGPKRVLGLPGNPASAIVCAHLFLRPLVQALLGFSDPLWPPMQTAELEHALPANGARETYMRARISPENQARVLEDQDSSLLSVFARANSLVVRPANAAPASAGDTCSYIPLST